MVSETEDDRLAALRRRIDKIDQDLQRLISERAECAQQVAAIKQALGGNSNFYRPEREAQVLRRVQQRNQGPLSDEEIARLFREIMSACLALEEPLRVAFLGPEGTYTQAAATKHFGRSIHALPMRAIDEVFREVESGSADYGVVPVENSTEGVVNHTLDMFLLSPLKICGEVEIRIHQHLITRQPSLEGIKRVYSHQQSLAQCREWLDLHLPRVEQQAVSSNGEAARRALADADSAAIAGECAAEIYDLAILVSNIEDDPNNTTRFLVVGSQSARVSGDDKTSLLLSSRNRVGSLHRLLEPISRNALSMTRIESRPSRRGMWDYVFFIDVDGHQSAPNVAKALSELEQEATLFKVLGSYPKAVL
jgi:chorismate mutase/prephenate dehydratase